MNKPKIGWPVKKKNEDKISSKFGMRMHPIHKEERFHYGVDFNLPLGEEIISSTNGVCVLSKESSTGFGNWVLIYSKFKKEYLGSKDWYLFSSRMGNFS